jgi:hypothetical protein
MLINFKKFVQILFQAALSFHSSVTEDSHVLGYDAVLLDE